MMSRFEDAARELVDRGMQLPPEAQEELAQAIEALTACLDGAQALASEKLRLSYGPISVDLHPRTWLAKLSKLAPPLKVKK